MTRLNNKKNEPSLAVRISLEATELPTEVWLGSTPYNVQAYAAPVRRCTKCQSLGHTKQQCRARQGLHVVRCRPEPDFGGKLRGLQ